MMAAKMLCLIFLASINTLVATNSFEQIGKTGEEPQLRYQLNLKGGQKNCLALGATGMLGKVNMSFSFNAMGDQEAWAADMFVTVNATGIPGDNSACYQWGGYDINYFGCTIAGKWPSSWQTGATGDYIGTADFSVENLGYQAGSATPYWEVCIGNGWRECPVNVEYNGTSIMFGLSNTAAAAPSRAPTLSPSPTTRPPVLSARPSMAPSTGVTPVPTVIPIVVEESCNVDVTVEFDTYLKGGESVYEEFPGDGDLQNVHVRMYFGGATATDAEWASDMIFELRDSLNKQCITIGGFDYNTQGCDYVGTWPPNWQTSSAGIYSASIDVSQYGIQGNATYITSIINGYLYGEDKVYYVGNFTLEGLNYDCYIPPETYIRQTSAVNQPLSVSYDLRLTGAEKLCTEVLAEGAVGQTFVEVDFDANNYAGAWASDMFLTFESINSFNTLECVQWGGFDYVQQGCQLQGRWPASWEGGSKSEQGEPAAYAAIANFSNPMNVDIQWRVCIGNGWRESGGFATYFGELEVSGLTTTGTPATPVPTPQPAGPRASPTARPTSNFVPVPQPTQMPGTIPLEVVSPGGTTLVLGMDTSLKGGEQTCIQFDADGSLLNVIADLIFGGAVSMSGEWASDMLFWIIGPNLRGVQIGGYDIAIPNCTFGGYWPSNWDTSTAGEFRATINVTSFGLTGQGMYTACVANGYYYGEYPVSYRGTLTLSGMYGEGDYISQSAAPGETPILAYSLLKTGGQQSCAPVAADGTLTTVDMFFYFNRFNDVEAWPSDMYLTVNATGIPNDNTACYQWGGYDLNVRGCTIIGSWPDDWRTDADGYFKGTADFSSLMLVSPYWEVCIGNGWRECTTGIEYIGNATMNGLKVTSLNPPTRSPTPRPSNTAPTTRAPIQTARPSMAPSNGVTPVPTVIPIVVEESCNVDVTVEFDTYLKGGQHVREEFPGDGELEFVVVNMFFGGASASSAEWASDMLFELRDEKNRTCISIGGFDFNERDCTFVSYWPLDWETSSAGHYSAVIDVRGYGIGGNSTYITGIANGYVYGENSVYYIGNITLDGLYYDCYIPPETYIRQTSTQGQPLRVSYDLRLTGSEKLCTNVLAEGKVGKTPVEVDFDANGWAGAWASDMFLSIRSIVGGSTCVQWGGYDYVETGCTLQGRWPASWNGGSKSEQGEPAVYEALANFTSSNSFTEYSVCIGNGWRESGGTATYYGELEVRGLTTTGIPPTPVPTPQPAGPRASPTARPTKSPSVATFQPTPASVVPLAIISAPDTTAMLQMNTFLSGGQQVCTTFDSTGTLQRVNVSLTFGGATPSSAEWASDMLFWVIGPNYKGVQIGGYDVFIDNCTFAGYWPYNWDTSTAGNYFASVDVAFVGVTGAGKYTACVENGYFYGVNAVSYKGPITLIGQTYTGDGGGDSGGGDSSTPVTETAAFIVPITLLFIGLAGGVAFYFYYKNAVANGTWKAWSGTSWRSSGPDTKRSLNSPINPADSSVGPGGATIPNTTSAYVPPTVAAIPATKAMVVNPMRGGISKDERL